MAATTFLWAIAYSSPPRLNFAQRLCVAYWFFVEREPQISSCCAFAVSTFSRIVVCSAPLLHYCERFHEKRSKRNAQLEDLQWSLNCERLLCVCAAFDLITFAHSPVKTNERAIQNGLEKYITNVNSERGAGIGLLFLSLSVLVW